MQQRDDDRGIEKEQEDKLFPKIYVLLSMLRADILS